MKELRQITRQDITANTEITGFLASNSDVVPAVVTREGNVFYVAEKMHRRIGRIFWRTLDRVLGVDGYHEISITPVEFDQLMARLAEIPETREGDSEEAFNASLEWVFNTAIEKKASDVYLFISQRSTRLEMKTYGVKEQITVFNVDLGKRLASLIWQQGRSQYDASTPCDCRFSFDYRGQVHHIRANSLCTADGGNAIACRVRDPKQIMPLDELGYAEQQIEHLNDMINAPGGSVLFTGPTNSGKSTSVASLMSSVPVSDYMIEVADPVEVEFDHCTQIELDRHRQDHEAVFGQILAALVRQNPDILVLGEIRDERTAAAAVNMALQGKRIYSTLHATTAVGVFSRLEGLGVPEHVLALPEFIAGIVSQNLVPETCAHCARDFDQVSPTLRPYDHKLLRGLDSGPLRFVNPDGCNHCIKGVTGQTLVAEVHPYVNDGGEIYDLITTRQYHRLAHYMQGKHRVQTKAQHAFGKIVTGRIDPLVTMRIIGGFDARALTVRPAAGQPLRFAGVPG